MIMKKIDFQLGQDIEFDETVHSICIVCLGPNNTSNPEGNVTIAGWGDTAGRKIKIINS